MLGGGRNFQNFSSNVVNIGIHSFQISCHDFGKKNFPAT